MEQATTAPAFTFEQNWDNDGMFNWHNAKTVKRYKELSNAHPDTDKLPVFYAFGQKQFGERLTLLRRKYGEDIVIKSAGAGLYGTVEGLNAVLQFYADRDKRIAEECAPPRGLLLRV